MKYSCPGVPNAYSKKWMNLKSAEMIPESRSHMQIKNESPFFLFSNPNGKIIEKVTIDREGNILNKELEVPEGDVLQKTLLQVEAVILRMRSQLSTYQEPTGTYPIPSRRL